MPLVQILHDIPQGWSNPSTASPLMYLTLLLFVPVAVGAIVTALVLLPGFTKGKGWPKASENNDGRIVGEAPTTDSHH